MCKSFRGSFGLVTALAVALLCNLYLIFLLWSGGQNDSEFDMIAPPDISKTEKSIHLKNVGLNLDYLKSMLNATKRLKRNQSRQLISTMNKLKRELKSQGRKLSDMLNSTSKVKTHVQ